MSKLKQLDQSVFKSRRCLSWVKSAFVDINGKAWGCELQNPKLRKRRGTYTADKRCRYTLIGEGYDASDWQNSAINRGE